MDFNVAYNNDIKDDHTHVLEDEVSSTVRYYFYNVRRLDRSTVLWYFLDDFHTRWV